MKKVFKYVQTEFYFDFTQIYYWFWLYLKFVLQ